MQSLTFFCRPELRDELVKNWRRYEPSELLVDLIRNFEMSKGNRSTPQIIKISPDCCDLVLDESFESAMFDLGSYSTSPAFAQRYPELAPFVFGHRSTTQVKVCRTQSQSGAAQGNCQTKTFLEVSKEHTTTTRQPTTAEWQAMSSVLDFRSAAPSMPPKSSTGTSNPKANDGVHNVQSPKPDRQRSKQPTQNMHTFGPNSRENLRGTSMAADVFVVPWHSFLPDGRYRDDDGDGMPPMTGQNFDEMLTSSMDEIDAYFQVPDKVQVDQGFMC